MRKLKIFCMVFLLMASGCATDPGVKAWWTLRESNFRELHASQSTKDDVIKLLGKPVAQMTFPSQGVEVWDYRYADGSVHMLAWVYFDMQGKYKYYVPQPDPAIYSGLW